MEYFNFFIFSAIFFVFIILLTVILSRLKILTKEFKDFRLEFREKSEAPVRMDVQPPVFVEAPVETDADTVKKRAEEVFKEPEKVPEAETPSDPILSDPVTETITETGEKIEEVKEEVRESIETPAVEEQKEPELIASAVPPPVQPFVVSTETKKEKSKAESTSTKTKNVKKKKFDIEDFIGLKVLGKIAIVVIVLGLGFYVKVAIDKHWINEVGRVAIGIAAGGILLGFAHWLRRKYRAFSSVLAGGGFAVLYMTIYLGFHYYNLFNPQYIAFIVMLVITAFAVVLSLTYDRQELAVLAILGGFATPFLVSTGDGNYQVMFSYLLILNAGMLVLAFFKRWYLINIISFVFTILIFGMWLTTKVLIVDSGPLTGALFFATLFYLGFFAMNIINNITKNRKLGFFEVFMLLANSGLYYLAGMLILHQISDGEYKGIFTAAMAIFNFIIAIALYKNNKVDKNLIYLLVGIVLTFVSLVAPAQLEGTYITVFWAAEAVLILWLAQQTGLKVIKLGSIIVTFVMITSLMIDWAVIYGEWDANLDIILNKGFVTSIFSVVSLAAVILLLKREKDKRFILGLSVSNYKIVLIPILIVFLYLSLQIELQYQVSQYFEFKATKSVYTAVLNFGYVLVLMIWARFNNTKFVLSGSVILGLIACLAFLGFYYDQFLQIREGLLDPFYHVNYPYWEEVIPRNDVTSFQYMFHYVGIVLLLGITALTTLNLRKIGIGPKAFLNKASIWFGVFILLFVLTSELNNIVVVSGFEPGESISDLLRQCRKIGYPILWGVTSFVLMLLGIKTKTRHLRLLSLIVFLIILVKLFAYDISGVNELGKVAAFISVGVMLLIVAFLYQKWKWIILDKGTEEEKAEIAADSKPDDDNTVSEPVDQDIDK